MVDFLRLRCDDEVSDIAVGDEHADEAGLAQRRQVLVQGRGDMAHVCGVIGRCELRAQKEPRLGRPEAIRRVLDQALPPAGALKRKAK
jgi:hypothetical protein